MDRFKYSFLSPGIVINVCPRSRQRIKNFREDRAKEKYGKQIYTKTKYNSRKKHFQDESGDEPDALDELPLGESYRINHFLPIINSLLFALSQIIATYSGLNEKFDFFSKLCLGEISDDDLFFAAKNLVEIYPQDFEPKLETALVHFNTF